MIVLVDGLLPFSGKITRNTIRKEQARVSNLTSSEKKYDSCSSCLRTWPYANAHKLTKAASVELLRKILARAALPYPDFFFLDGAIPTHNVLVPAMGSIGFASSFVHPYAHRLMILCFYVRVRLWALWKQTSGQLANTRSVSDGQEASMGWPLPSQGQISQLQPLLGAPIGASQVITLGTFC